MKTPSWIISAQTLCKDSITMQKYFKGRVGFFPEGHDLLFADYRPALSPHNDIVGKLDEKAFFR